jgi:diguanylate cyclase (GGDEF)-like protein
MSHNQEDEISYGLQLERDFSRFKNAVIMMVDDEPLVMEVLQALLEEQDYCNFTLVSDSKEAFDSVRVGQPDVLLLDLKMPDVDGFEILRQLRRDPVTRFLSIIVLTSSTDSATKLKALEMGATDFLAKPVDGSELALRLRNTLALKAYQDQLAYYDSLTQLPNRKLFLDRLAWAVTNADRDEESVALLLISLDRYSAIRDTLGPKASDNLVRQVASRLVGELRASDTISHSGMLADWRNLARVSPHEFSVLLPGVSNAERLSSVAERLRASLRSSFQVEEHEVFMTGSIGIAVYPTDATDADALVKSASAATAHAKGKGRDLHQFYSEEMDVASKQRLSMETALRKALSKDELLLYFQPQISTTTGEVVGAEALLRWQREKYGMVSPAEFIPVAEELGLITSIGEWVIFEACQQAAMWEKQGLENLQYSVNVSGYQFQDGSLPAILNRALTESRLPPRQLMIEITESVLLGDREKIISLLNQVRSVGARLSIDDFGTDYASLSYLRDFTLDELKIDRSFIMNVVNKKQDSAIVEAVIGLAHSLGLHVVAEGVEERAQLDYLRQLGCDIIQGFYFAKPMPPEAFYDYCTQHLSRNQLGVLKSI